MYTLYNNATGAEIGTISDEQLKFLRDQLEEESLEDRDYAIEAMTLAYFEELGIDPALSKMLRQALGDQEQIIIRWG
jgi:hypothetical protein